MENKTSISIYEISSMLIEAQGKLADIDGRSLSIGSIMEDVGLTRRAYYGLWDLHKMTAKSTVIKMAVAFGLSEIQLEKLMSYCGYIFPHNRTDEIIQSFFIKEDYDYEQIDKKLKASGESPIFTKITAKRKTEMDRYLSSRR